MSKINAYYLPYFSKIVKIIMLSKFLYIYGTHENP